MQGVCILKNDKHEEHGIVRLKQKGYTLAIKGKVWGVPPGNHGFHIHKNGNEINGSHTLCEHYNPQHKNHGGLDERESHAGDLGNFIVGNNGVGYYHESTEKVKLEEIFGRSIVFHDGEDDLGKGGQVDSLSTGHSGGRMLYGIIGRDEGGCV